MKPAWLVVTAAFAALAGGCGDTRNCQSACVKIWDECGVELNGISTAEALSDCRESCEGALEKAGDMGTYNPRERFDALDPPVLENEKQAAEWMDCVFETDCADIQPEVGVCGPLL